MAPDLQLPAPASRHALALLRFPDARTAWVVVTVATLQRPVPDLAERIADLHRAVPMCGARLRHETWTAGSAPSVEQVAGDPLGHPTVDRAFHLGAEAPLRIVLGDDGRRLAVVGHHAAFDGLAFVAILRALTGGPLPQPVTSPPPGPGGSPIPVLARLIGPADRVAPSTEPTTPRRDAYATADVLLSGRAITGRLAQAAVRAASEHNRRLGAELRKVGLTIAVGGPAGVGNVASYRRIDVAPRAPIADLVQDALRSPDEPGEQLKAPRLLLRALAPVVDRFSDTLLVSNLGRHELPGVRQLDFFPVARGRSAVCVGSAAIVGGDTSITVRARDLSPADAEQLAHRIAELLDPSSVRVERRPKRP